MTDTHPFIQTYRGAFAGILRWPQLDELWGTLLHETAKQWYVYAVGETLPTQPSNAEQLDTFLTAIDKLLRSEHEEDYCGIVYVDNRQSPTFIKIYDPNNLGVVCGFSDNPPLPGWILSLQQPIDLQAALPPPGKRRRWWQKLLGSKSTK
jgi:hypothetical protein